MNSSTIEGISAPVFDTHVDFEAGGLDILNKNTLTTAGVLVAGSTGLAATALVVTALPAQMLVAAGLSAGLIYAGDRQDKGLSMNPFSSDSTDAATPVEASA